MTRAWSMFQSGSKIDWLNPRSDAWTDRDLAVGLSRPNRWGGHSAWDYPLSCAEAVRVVIALLAWRSTCWQQIGTTQHAAAPRGAFR